MDQLRITKDNNSKGMLRIDAVLREGAYLS